MFWSGSVGWLTVHMAVTMLLLKVWTVEEPLLCFFKYYNTFFFLIQTHQRCVIKHLFIEVQDPH